jgi:beta-aspartyl-peptidase (threonine type)
VIQALSACVLVGAFAWCAVDLGWANDIPHAVAIHGGAGTISREEMTPEREQAYRQALETSLLTADSTLAAGGSALDAVVAAIVTMEDCPLFNAGKGAVFTGSGIHELDASLMNGADLAAGAVAAVRHVKNPILLARAVMERSPHVFMMGAGAEEFAAEQGFELVDSTYFDTEYRRQQLQRAREKAARDGRGTVGVVCRDKRGNLAAGTSTGGMTNKRWGRVGDSPVIGAGTYADNRTCAVSATGDGEYFLRLSVARDVSALVEYRGLSVEQAADTAIAKVGELGGEGGLVAIDRDGNIAFAFNSAGMYRGYLKQGGKPFTAIYRD